MGRGVSWWIVVGHGGANGGCALGVGLLDVLEQRPDPVHDALVALGVPEGRCVVNISKLSESTCGAARSKTSGVYLLT
mgnify:CR=1 FL=1